MAQDEWRIHPHEWEERKLAVGHGVCRERLITTCIVRTYPNYAYKHGEKNEAVHS